MGFFDLKKEASTVETIKTGIVDMYDSGKFSFFGTSGSTVDAYYSIDLNKSTTSEGYNDVTEYVGTSSPVRYGRIKGLILYGMVVESEEENDDTIGINTVLGENQAVVINKTIKPITGDHFSYEGLLMVVTSAKRTQFKNNPFWIITYSESVVSNGLELIENQVDQRYLFKKEHIATQFKNIILEEDDKILDKVVKYLRRLNDVYMGTFYKRKLGTLLFDLNTNAVYSPYMRTIQTDLELLELDGMDLVMAEETREDKRVSSTDCDFHILKGLVEREVGLDEYINPDTKEMKCKLSLRGFNPKTEYFSHLKYLNTNVRIIQSEPIHELSEVVPDGKIGTEIISTTVNDNIYNILKLYEDGEDTLIDLSVFYNNVKKIRRLESNYFNFILIPTILRIGKKILLSIFDEKGGR